MYLQTRILPQPTNIGEYGRIKEFLKDNFIMVEIYGVYLFGFGFIFREVSQGIIEILMIFIRVYQICGYCSCQHTWTTNPYYCILQIVAPLLGKISFSCQEMGKFMNIGSKPCPIFQLGFFLKVFSNILVKLEVSVAWHKIQLSKKYLTIWLSIARYSYLWIQPTHHINIYYDGG